MGNNVEMEITQLLAAYSSEAVQKAGEDLITEIRRERKEHADAAAAEIQTLLKRVFSEEAAKATKPEDLDGLLVELQKFQTNRYGGYNVENQALFQQVSGAFEFTKLWQNYLSHLATGQTQLVINDLQNLSQNNYAVGIIPRSHILELLAACTNPQKGAPGEGPSPTTAESIVENIKTLDDMEPALKQLKQLQSTNPSNGDLQQMYFSLAPLVQTYNDVKAGAPSNVNWSFSSGNERGISAALKAQLMIFILRHYLDAYKGTPPAADEKPATYVNRVIADAVSREDWPLLQRAISAQSYLNRNAGFGSNGLSTSGSAGADNLLIALNQEAARQYAEAVVSYQNALKYPDSNIPGKLIGDKLEAIREDHRRNSKEGCNSSTRHAAPRYSTYPGMPYRPGMPGYPGSPVPQSPSGLSIPASRR